MCGIFGVVCPRGAFTRQRGESAVSSLAHRGPSGRGLELVSIDGWDVWLGHTRLAILDLSSRSDQPMLRSVGGRRTALVFNGEIYNFRSLRRELVEWEFETSGDTEVLLAAAVLLGPGEACRRVNGMVAAAFLDVERRTFSLMRDRLGKKPLYVYERDGLFAWASELKAFEAAGLPLTLDASSMATWRWLGYIPGVRTPYVECRRVAAGCCERWELRPEGMRRRAADTYWDPFATAAERFTGSYEDAIDEVLSVLDDATRLRLESDVPIGLFLSAGVDSTLVASSAARVGTGRITAYTVRERGARMDESAVAAATARALGLPIEILEVEPFRPSSSCSLIAEHFDDPIADLSILPTLAICQAAAQEVRVALTGDGGDEVFLGYPFLRQAAWLQALNAACRWVPARSRLRALTMSSAGTRTVRVVAPLLGLSTSNLEFKQYVVAEALAEEAADRVYADLRSMAPRLSLPPRVRAQLFTPSPLALAEALYPTYSWDALASRSIEEGFAGLELTTFMRDDILVKVDRASMAFGLEARSPLLDHRMVELGFRLPASFKSRPGQTKRLLRDALRRRLPHSRAPDLPKHGFVVDLPVDAKGTITERAAWGALVLTGWYERWAPGEGDGRSH